jgi:hypothetical protein
VTAEYEPTAEQAWLMRRQGDDFVVLKGLKAGERIATSANFLIEELFQSARQSGSGSVPS